MNGIDHFDRFTEPAKVVIERADIGINFARARAAVENRQNQGEKTASVVLVLSTMCKSCLLLAVDEAEQRDGRGSPIRSEHLLLGLLREEKGVIADILLELGTSVSIMRTKLLEAMGESDLTKVL